MRAEPTGRESEPWREEEGDPFLDPFSALAHDLWENKIRRQAPVQKGRQ